MRDVTHIGEDQGPERQLRDVTASTTALVSLDLQIETKFHTPAARKEWVERQGLIQQLASAAGKLILVDAPAGFGKSTLVAQWSASPLENRQFAWLTLDAADNDPGRLWWHVVCALQRACPELEVADVLHALRVRFPDIQGTVLPLLINELAGLKDTVILALDDYDLIQESACHDQVKFLLLRLAPSARIVLMTRVDPPLPLARMRAAGEVVEIRARDLRLARADAAELVRAVADVELSEPDLDDLLDRTEGWPAGLYLAALSLHEHPAPSEFIRKFTGDSRYVVDFLSEEVLSRQPAEIRQFLRRTSILSTFCAPLCDSVVGQAGSAEIIDTLDRQNLFVVPLDDTRRWYRYHHLFAQMLRGELSRTEPEAILALHQRAGAWHRVAGSADLAIEHAVAADDIAGAVELIAQHWYAYIDSGLAATVRRWIRTLGEDAIGANPVAAHCAAWTAALLGDQRSVRRWLPVIDSEDDQGPLPDGITSLRSSASLLRGTFGFDGIGPMRKAAARAVMLESDPVSPWFALAQVSLSASLYWSGDLAGAAEHAMLALRARASIATVRIQALAVMAHVAIEQGRLADAEELARSAKAMATDVDIGLQGTPQSTIAYGAVGAVYAANGRLQDARGEFERALTVRRRWPGISPWPTLEILLRLAPVLRSLGDPEGAALLFDEASQLLASLPAGAEAQLARLGRLAADRPQIASPGEPLTERQTAVLALLGGTLSLREIGAQLYISPNTVKSHARAIYRKLGVSSRQEAVAKVHEGELP